MSDPDALVPSLPERPWEELQARIQAGQPSALLAHIDGRTPAETARAISRFTQPDQPRLFGFLPPADADSGGNPNHCFLRARGAPLVTPVLLC